MDERRKKMRCRESCCCCETGWSNGGFVLDRSSSERVVLLMTAEGLWGRHFQPNVLYRERRQRRPAAFSAINLNWSSKVQRPWGPRSPRLFLYSLPRLGRLLSQLVCGCKGWLFCWARQPLNWPSQCFQVPSPSCLCSGPPVWGVMAACCFPVSSPRALWNSELWCIGLLHSLWNIVVEFTEVINCNDQQPQNKRPIRPSCLSVFAGGNATIN